MSNGLLEDEQMYEVLNKMWPLYVSDLWSNIANAVESRQHGWCGAKLSQTKEACGFVYYNSLT